MNIPLLDMQQVVLTAFTLASVCFPIACRATQDKGQAEEMPLSTQLEGLAPDSRIAYLRHLMQTGKRNAEIYFQLGVAFHENAQADSAEHYYKLTITDSPGTSKAHVNLGVLYDDQGMDTAALEQFELAIAVNPTDILALSHAALMRFQLLEDYRNAIDYILQAISLEPENPQPHFYLAIFFWENHMYREAMREWQKVVDVDPGSRLARMAQEQIMNVQNAMRGESFR